MSIIGSYHTKRNAKRLGFTLVELAIVLAVTGVMFVGLYRLLSGGNAQVKDSSVASQQAQLISSVKAFLGTTQGGNWMGTAAAAAAGVALGSAPVPSENLTLALPSSADAPDGTTNIPCHGFYADANEKSFCDNLPAGFSTGTMNAYGQFYLIQVQTGPIPVGATAPSTYSFMVVTTGGDTIPDADGGRISSEIGADGGFLYSNATICGAVGTWACGSYGGWSAAITTYGFAAKATGGYVASRTYTSPETGTSPWLARQFISGNSTATTVTASSPNYNTMQVDMYLGGKNLWFSNSINVTPPYVPASGTMNLQGGTINLEQGSIVDTNSAGSSINLSTSPSTYLNSTTSNALIILNTYCSTVGANPNNCQAALQVNGDENVTGQLNANTLFAGTFIYQTSDRRLKTDIVPVAHELDDVMRLKPVNFTFKASGQKSLGVIAQDLETVYPQLVTEKTDGMKSVNYDGLVAPLIAAVQELKQQNDMLRQELSEQSKRQDKLEKSLSKPAN